MKFNRILASIATTAALLSAPLAANAVLVLHLDDLSVGGLEINITDGGAGDSNPLVGAITYVGAVGGWTLSVTTALGNDLYSGFGIDLNTVSVGAGQLQLSMSETGLMYGAGPAASLPVTAAINGNSSAGSTLVDASVYVDDSNASFGMGTLIYSDNLQAIGAGNGFSGVGTTSATLTDPFSMSAFVKLTHFGNQTTSFDFQSYVPEPGSLALAGLALVGLGVASRRKA